MASSAKIHDPRRTLPFLLAVLLHAGLLYLLAKQLHSASIYASLPDQSLDTQPTILTFLPDPEKPENSPVDVAPVAPRRRLEASQPEITVPPPPFTGLEQNPEPANDGPAAPGIDWRLEGEKAARNSAPQPEAGPARAAASDKPKKKPEFGWSHSRIHRIEALEGGGIIWNINDHCSIVIKLIPMGGCTIGKIPPRGDLFDHMRDPPELGDWKEK